MLSSGIVFKECFLQAGSEGRINSPKLEKMKAPNFLMPDAGQGSLPNIRLNQVSSKNICLNITFHTKLSIQCSQFGPWTTIHFLFMAQQSSITFSRVVSMAFLCWHPARKLFFFISTIAQTFVQRAAPSQEGELNLVSEGRDLKVLSKRRI